MSSKKWMRLDNAAKIYPAAKKRGWTALFRVSMDLKEEIDPALLSEALSSSLLRYPSFRVSIRRGLFWFYLEHNDALPPVLPDVCCPCPYLNSRYNGNYSLRVRYYRNRIAVEFYHVLTDGTGGLSFVKTLVAEYLRLKKGIALSGSDILLCGEEPTKGEMRDSFPDYAGEYAASRTEADSFQFSGKKEPDRFVNLICGTTEAEKVLAEARENGVSVTEYLTAVLIESFLAVEAKKIPLRRKRKPVKICVPVNLRKFFPSETVRNFSNYINPGIDPRLGDYSFEEILRSVHHQMGEEKTPQKLRAKFTANVRSEQNPFLRVVPLFLKNIVMKAVYRKVGDRKTCTNLSNLGKVTLPPQMEEEVTGVDFILGPLAENPIAFSVLTYRGEMKINVTRTVCEADVEREFFTRLVRKGIPIRLSSNLSSRPDR